MAWHRVRVQQAETTSKFMSALRVVGVLLVATTLRPPVAGVGPLLPEIRRDLGMSGAQAGVLTALPVLCFGLAAFAGPSLARRFGLERTIGAVLLLVGAGIAVRSSGGMGLLFLGSAVLALAIAVANVLLPAIIKADFPDSVGLMTGAYTTVMSLAAAVAAAIAVPVADALGGWRASLAVWLVAVGLAFVAWLPQSWHPPVHETRSGPRKRVRLFKSLLAWAVAVYFGLQSLGFYVLLNWLPTLLQDRGYSPTTAGALLSLMSVVGLPLGLLIPAVAARRETQSVAAIFTTALTAIGLLGLWLLPGTATTLFIVAIGFGMGATFPLSLTLVALRASGAAAAGELSAMVQGYGYLMAAAGTFMVGVLHSLFDGWSLVLAVMVGLTGIQAVAGWYAGGSRTIG